MVRSFLKRQSFYGPRSLWDGLLKQDTFANIFQCKVTLTCKLNCKFISFSMIFLLVHVSTYDSIHLLVL